MVMKDEVCFVILFSEMLEQKQCWQSANISQVHQRFGLLPVSQYEAQPHAKQPRVRRLVSLILPKLFSPRGRLVFVNCQPHYCLIRKAQPRPPLGSTAEHLCSDADIDECCLLRDYLVTWSVHMLTSTLVFFCTDLCNLVFQQIHRPLLLSTNPPCFNVAERSTSTSLL